MPACLDTSFRTRRYLTYEDKTPVDAAKVLKPNPTMAALYQTMKQRGIILDATLFPYESK